MNSVELGKFCSHKVLHCPLVIGIEDGPFTVPFRDPQYAQKCALSHSNFNLIVKGKYDSMGQMADWFILQFVFDGHHID